VNTVTLHIIFSKSFVDKRAPFRIHILSIRIPFIQNILLIKRITFNEWLYVLALAIPMILAMEVFKLINENRN
jgi:hypothetical protein